MRYMNHISEKEISALDMKAGEIIAYIEKHKIRIASNDYRDLINSLHQVRRTFSNMQHLRHLSPSSAANPYGNWCQTNPYGGQQAGRTPDGWEAQFDESLLMRPPNYLLPPMGGRMSAASAMQIHKV